MFAGRALLLRLAFLSAEEEAVQRGLESTVGATLLDMIVDRSDALDDFVGDRHVGIHVLDLAAG